MSLNILSVGGSRHIGYYASLRFLDAGARVTFLLRSPDAFDNDADVQKHVKTGNAILVKGDATIVEDVRKVWEKATEHAPVDLVLYTLGFTGSNGFSLTQGMTMDPADLATRCMLNVLRYMPKSAGVPLPKLIALSTTGVSATSRKAVGLTQRPIYGWLIKQPLKDKLGMERVIYHCAGWTWNPADGEPDERILPKGWEKSEGLPESGTLQNAMVLRASMLDDGPCKADSSDKLPYHAVEGPDGGKSISRKDVAHFIYHAVTNNWEKYGNKQISVSY